jgi:hypothetical protein
MNVLVRVLNRRKGGGKEKYLLLVAGLVAGSSLARKLLRCGLATFLAEEET